jgi:hypothetical protein
MAIKVFANCSRCDGTGFDPRYPSLGGNTPNRGPCESCGATGFIEWGHSDTLDNRLQDMEDKIDDIMDKCNDIYEKVSE